MRFLAIACLVVAACAPCPGQRYVATRQAQAAQLQPELASCAGQRVCNAPCVALFQLTPEDVIETCSVTVDASGNGTVVARYIDRSVCGGADVLDPASGDVVADDGSWADWSDDGSTDDGSTDGSTDDGSSDGTTDDGSSTTDDGSSTTDDGSTDDGTSGRQIRNPTAASWAPIPDATNTVR